MRPSSKFESKFNGGRDTPHEGVGQPLDVMMRYLLIQLRGSPLMLERSARMSTAPRRLLRFRDARQYV